MSTFSANGETSVKVLLLQVQNTLKIQMPNANETQNKMHTKQKQEYQLSGSNEE